MQRNKKTSLYSTFLGQCIGHIGVSNGVHLKFSEPRNVEYNEVCFADL